MIDSAALRARLNLVRDRVARAAERSQRDPSSVGLIAISKTFDADHVRAAADAGQVDFGENKVQEALQKMDATADLSIRWHLVGHLQSNKAKKASRFSVVHSIDSSDLLRRVADAAAADGRNLEVLIQADLAGEATKYGAPAEELEAICRAAAGIKGATLVGLMLLPPSVEDPNQARPHFRALQQVRAQLLGRGIPPAMLKELSMGMSHDFEVAIEEGATMVRVGTAIFGARTYL